MKSKGFIPVSIGFSLLVCIVLMGIPIGPTPPFGNFSGEIVYASEEGNFDLNGTYNLYECRSRPAAIQLRLILGNGEKLIEVDRATGTFTSSMNLGTKNLESVEAYLLVDGRIVASSVISLSSGSEPSVRIIRFASFSPAA